MKALKTPVRCASSAIHEREQAFENC